MIEKSRLKPLRDVTLAVFFNMIFLITSFGQEPNLDSLKNQLHIVKPIGTTSLKDSTYVNILNVLASEIRYNQNDSILTLSEEALNYSRNIGFIKGEIQALINLSNYHSDKGHQEMAAELLNKALEQSRNHKLSNLELQSLYSLAKQHSYLDKNQLAFKEMLDGIDSATKHNNLKYLSLFNLNIGVLYQTLNEYQEAISYLKNSRKFAEKYGDESILASINSNLAFTYNAINQPETSIKVIDDAIVTFENSNDNDWLAFAYAIKGNAYAQLGNYKSALDWFKKSEELYNTVVDDERIEILLLLGMAKTYKDLEEYDIAVIHAKRAFELAQVFKNKERQKNASELLYTLYKKKNELVKSFKYLEIFQQLSENLARDESKKSMLISKTKLDYDKQKEDLIENNKKSLARQTNIIFAILMIVLVLTGFIFLVLRNQKVQKKLNEELKLRELELIKINNTKDKLFSIISHDLRGPINAFSRLITMFNNGQIEKNELTHFVPKLGSDINSISFTLNNLLSWGRAQMKGVVTKPVNVDLAQIISENINLLSEISRNKSIHIHNTIEQNSIAWADRDQLDVVVRNLMSNALKFTPKNGSVTITGIAKNHNWKVTINDTGIGMDEETQNKIFDQELNITTYGTENEKGTGLGLNLCKELVENNKGKIWVNSILNQGSSFTFTLPKNPD
jgi:signal transduction histidine kinase